MSDFLQLSLKSHFPIIFATFLGHFFSFGPIYSFGVFVPPLKDDFGTSLDAAASAHSLMIGMQFMGSLLAGLALPHRMSHRAVNLLGAIAVLIGFFGASFAGSIELVYATLGILAGVGLGACNLAGLTALNSRVKTERALAVGIATSGTGVATMALPPIYTALLETAGWRWAMRVNGIATSAVFLAITPLLRLDDDVKADKAGNPSVTGMKRHIPCGDKRYLCWFLNMIVCFLGYFAPVTLLAEFVKEILEGSSRTAAQMYTIIGICAFLSRISLGFSTRYCGGARCVHFLAQAVNGILVVVLPLCWSTESLAIWCAIYGFTVGPVIGLISVILSELFGTKVLPLYHGLSRFAVGLGTFAGPPFIAYLAETYSYNLACAVAGSTILAGGCFLLLLAWLQASMLKTSSQNHHVQSKQHGQETDVKNMDVISISCPGIHAAHEDGNSNIVSI